MSETFYIIVVFCVTGLIALAMVVIQTNINVQASAKNQKGEEHSIHLTKKKETSSSGKCLLVSQTIYILTLTALLISLF